LHFAFDKLLYVCVFQLMIYAHNVRTAAFDLTDAHQDEGILSAVSVRKREDVFQQLAFFRLGGIRKRVLADLKVESRSFLFPE
jgi:hypothetical protein